MRCTAMEWTEMYDGKIMITGADGSWAWEFGLGGQGGVCGGTLNIGIGRSLAQHMSLYEGRAKLCVSKNVCLKPCGSAQVSIFYGSNDRSGDHP